MTCTEIAERGLIERYVSGALEAVDTEAFEAHLLGCRRCQTELRLAVAIRGALREPGASAPRERARLGLWVAGLALAAGISALFVLRPFARPSRWRDLDAVRVAPIYLGVEVRGAPARGDSLFATAMTAYDAHRYDAAAAGLRTALAAGADSAPAEFFLGAALLMLDRAGDASDAFARVIGLGATPYRAEAHLYGAKALLRQGRARSALTELRAVASSNPPNAVAAWARALADSVESRMQR